MINFRVIQGILAAMMVACYCAMLVQGSIMVTVLAMSLSRLTYTMVNFAIVLLNYNLVLFGAHGFCHN